MRNREELVTEANDLIEVISTYKVLKLDQIIKSIRNKEYGVKKSIIRLLQRQDRIYIFDDICSAEENGQSILIKELSLHSGYCLTSGMK